MARKHLIVASTLVMVIIIAVWFIAKPGHSHESPPPGMSAAIQVDPAALRALRTGVSFTETGASVEEARNAIRPVFEEAAGRDVTDELIVSQALRRALVEELSANVASRSASHPDAFMEMVLAKAPRWKPASDERAWTLAADFIGPEAAEGLDSDDPEASLRLINNAVLDSDLRLAALGGGLGGCVVKFGRVRNRDALGNELWMGDILNQYWLLTPVTAPIRLWSPSVSLEDVLHRHKSAAVARVCFHAKTARGTHTKIISTWFFDPGSGRWHCDEMYSSSRAWYAVIF